MEFIEIDRGVRSAGGTGNKSSIFLFRVLRNARDLTHKLVRQIHLALCCALGTRKVDLVEAETWRAKCEVN